MNAVHFLSGMKEANLGLLTHEYDKLVDVRDSEHLGHKMVAEVPRRHLHRLPRFPQLIDRLK